MFGSKKSPLKVAKPSSVDPVKSGSNPFDSDDEANDNRMYNYSRKSSGDHALVLQEVNINPFDDVDARKHASLPSYSFHRLIKTNIRMISVTLKGWRINHCKSWTIVLFTKQKRLPN